MIPTTLIASSQSQMALGLLKIIKNCFCLLFVIVIIIEIKMIIYRRFQKLAYS